MGDCFQNRMIDTIGFHVIVIYPVDCQAIHEMAHVPRELNGLPDMVGTILTDLSIQIIDRKQSVPYRPRLPGTDLQVGQALRISNCLPMCFEESVVLSLFIGVEGDPVLSPGLPYLFKLLNESLE